MPKLLTEEIIKEDYKRIFALIVDVLPLHKDVDLGNTFNKVMEALYSSSHSSNSDS